MVLKLTNVFISAFFGALGPFFNKQATLDKSAKIYVFFIERDIAWMIYVFDVLCIFLMLWVNTVSVKYKMLSYKHDGAFLGTSLIFILGYLFSAALDYVYEGTILSINQTGGALMMILGIILISMQEETDHVNKHTNSFYQFLPDKEDTENITKNALTQETGVDPDPMLDPSWKMQTETIEPGSVQKMGGKKYPKNVTSGVRSTAISRMPSRHLPGEIANLDFIVMRKGYI